MLLHWSAVFVPIKWLGAPKKKDWYVTSGKQCRTNLLLSNVLLSTERYPHSKAQTQRKWHLEQTITQPDQKGERQSKWKVSFVLKCIYFALKTFFLFGI